MFASSLILTAISGISILYFFHQNHNRKVERFYYRENKLLYALLMFVYFLLIVALVMNGRFVVTEVLMLTLAGFKPFKKYINVIRKHAN